MGTMSRLVTRVWLTYSSSSGQACPELPIWTPWSTLEAASWQAGAGDRCSLFVFPGINTVRLLEVVIISIGVQAFQDKVPLP